MTVTVRAYNHETDFIRVEQFLVDTFSIYNHPCNWMIDQWNFCRYFVCPVHTYYNTQYFGVPTLTHPPFRDEVQVWENTIRVWENENGQIVGVVNSENEEAGEAWIQIHPDYTYLYEQMVDYAETKLADRGSSVSYIKIYANEGTQLEHILVRRNYLKLQRMVHSEYKITGKEKPEQIPKGFVIKSVADEDNIEQRRIAKAMAFGGYRAPSSWPPASAFQLMQQAPAYRADLDLYIEAPNGDCASFCTIWLDAKNKYANFEPVGTRQEYQGLGLAKALLSEGFRRMALYGANRSYMQSNNPFYAKVGFQETSYAYNSWYKYF